MAIYTVLSRKVLAGFAEDYGLGKLTKTSGVAAGSVNTHYLLETPKGKFFLKIDEAKCRSEAQHELELLLFLRTHGFACPRPLANRDGRFLSDYEGKTVSVCPFIVGTVFAEKDFTLTQLEKTGRALASLHLLGQTYKRPLENRFCFERIADLYPAVKTHLPPHFRHLVHVLDDELNYQAHFAEERLPKGVIHGDLFADNILFRTSKVAAVLDFEAAGHGKFIYDLATAVNALCYIDGNYLSDRFDALVHGYQDARTLSLGEWDAFPNELRFSALRFTITRLKDFFLRPIDAQCRVHKDFRDFFERLQVLRRERSGGMDRLLMAMATGYDYRQYQKVRSQSQPASNLPAHRQGTNGRARVPVPGLTSERRRLQVAH